MDFIRFGNMILLKKNIIAARLCDDFENDSAYVIYLYWDTESSQEEFRFTAYNSDQRIAAYCRAKKRFEELLALLND